MLSPLGLVPSFCGGLTWSCGVGFPGIGWLLTQPGALCAQPAGGAAFSQSNAGICGGQLMSTWGCFCTSFFGFSSFGCSAVMWRADVIQDSFYTSNAAGLILVFAMLYESGPGAISRTSSKHAPLNAFA